ncbi:MFS transporter [Longispora fulva]|uniref:EmrB/QacA subfamily drug resistance transporter n=1 Tax=Longispora fulva TaxID=619741 RepID=A0A8J7KQE6_9ACTN|nr:MFS transporter [Longispora fulva]MBG6137322.1 EmrB/QacA subfamily drug resistance transporter [Longispora fulva]GIG61323.1 MFS transporter [Longispora fulva]
MAITSVLPGPAATRPAPWRALPVLLTGAFLPVLDAFIVNVALPSIGRDLHAGPAELELTVSGYGVAYACTLVAGGRLGDRFGRRRLFMVGMLAFTLMSTGCGLAPGTAALIGFRVAQGLAAALMFPQVLAAIQAGFTGGDRQRALGVFGAVIGAAGAVGQVLGGWLLSADMAGLSWRPLFLVNVPVGVVALLVCLRLVPETRTPTAPRVDVVGSVFLAAAIALVLLPLTLGRASGWPLWTWLCLAAAVPVGIGFLVSQGRSERSGGTPLLPPSLLRLPAARRALVAITLFAMCIGGFLFTTAITLQVGHGFTPVEAGFTMAPCTLAFLGVAVFNGRLVARYGTRMLVAGGVAFAVGLAGFGATVALSPQVTVVGAALPLTVAGLGWAALLVPLIGLVLAGLPAERAGLAGGVLSTAMQVGLALGASVLGSVLFAIVDGTADPGRWRVATLTGVAVECVLASTVAAVVGRLRAR